MSEVCADGGEREWGSLGTQGSGWCWTEPLSIPGGQWPPTPSIQAFLAVQGPLIVGSYPPLSPLEHSALICKPLGQFKELLFKEDAILTFLKL